MTSAAELLRAFLLGSRLYDEISAERFKDLFPAKYRDDEDIRRLYKHFQAERRQIRDVLAHNIESEARALSRATKRRRITSASLSEATDQLRQRTRALDAEAHRLEAQCEAQLVKLEKFDEALGAIPLPKTAVPNHLVTLDGTKSVVANLRAAAE